MGDTFSVPFILSWQPNNIIEVIYRYPHSFLGDRPDCFQVLCSSLTYASICCRKLFRSQCRLGLYMIIWGALIIALTASIMRTVGSADSKPRAMHIKAKIKICTKKKKHNIELLSIRKEKKIYNIFFIFELKLNSSNMFAYRQLYWLFLSSL